MNLKCKALTTKKYKYFEDIYLLGDNMKKVTDKYPFYQKLDENCPASEKIGTGPGSCGGGKDQTKTIASVWKEKVLGKKMNPVEEKEETFYPDIGHSKRIGIIDKGNVVFSTPAANEFAKVYMGAKKGDVKDAEVFYGKFKQVGNGKNSFDDAVIYQDKDSGKTYMVNVETNWEGRLGGKIHYVSTASKMMTEEPTKWSEPGFTRNNNSDIIRPGEYEITESIKVWSPTGALKPSNTYYGNTNILSQQLKQVTLNPGDKIVAKSYYDTIAIHNGNTIKIDTKEDVTNSNGERLNLYNDTIKRKYVK
jgi:hypothetical protein